MASRGFSKALRSQLARQVTSPAAQRRSFVAAANLVRATTRQAARPVVGVAHQQVRGVKTIDFAGTPEDVYGNTIPPSLLVLVDYLMSGRADGLRCMIL